MKRKIIIALVFLLLALSMAFFAIACDDGDNGEVDVNGDNASESYTITYTDGSGTVKTVTVGKGTVGISLESALKKGYVFEGYYTADGMMCFNSNGTPVSGLQITSNLTVYPKYTPFEYTLFFDAQVGVFDDGSDSKELNLQYGENIANAFPIPQSPVAKYEFDGWFSEDGKTRYSNGGTPVSDTLNADAYPLGANGSTLKLLAKFKARELNITLDYADGETLPVKLKVEYGSDFSFLAEYGKESGNKYVKKWSSESDGYYALPETVTQDMRIYAVWQRFMNITFVYSDTVSKTEKIDVTPGQTSVLPETAELPGYAFQGWYASKLFTGLPITQVYYGELADRYYAKWEAVQYTLNFITDSGESPASVSYYYGDGTMLPTVSKSGYRFMGWSETPRGGECFYAIPATLYGNKTLYANWVPNKFNVGLDSNGGSIDSEIATLEYGKTETLPVPTKDKYTFEGWYVGDVKCTDTDGRVIESAWGVLENATLTAKWTERMYKVRYESNGGSGVSEQTYYYGQTLRFPDDPKKSGVQFLGWFDKSLAVEFDCTNAVTDDMVLYAKWIDSTPISNAADFKNIANAPSGNYHLTCDINMYGEALTPIPEFKGVLNGNGYKIYNFVIDSSVGSVNASIGVFAVNSGVIRNLFIEHCNVMLEHTHTVSSGDVSKSYLATDCGILVGLNEGCIVDCQISNSSLIVNSTIAAKSNSSGNAYFKAYIGGMVGRTQNGKMLSCQVLIDITVNYNGNIKDKYSGTYAYVNYGGICGMLSGIMADNSYVGTLALNFISSGQGATGSSATSSISIAGITGTLSADSVLSNNISNCNIVAENNINITGQCSKNIVLYCGGIWGYGGKSSATVSCVANGKITANSNQRIYCGGIYGYSVHDLEIESCISNTDISISASVSTFIGGISGYSAGNIKNSYFTGTIRSEVAASIGGIAGHNTSTGSVLNCLNLGSITAVNGENVGYIVGKNEGVSNGNRYSSECAIGINGTVYNPPAQNGASKATADEVRTKDFYLNVIYWNPEVWYFEDGKLPVLRWIKLQTEQNGD